jgi:hypothetical protein
MKRMFVSFALSGTLLTNASAAPLKFQSGEKQVSLVELYTSEGCSSCPPAEAWMAGLKDLPELWKGFAPMAFHVDYWNSLGWKDRWSLPEFTGRQRAYAEAWKNDNIYTPCLVLNGKESHLGFFGGRIPAASAENVGVLAVSTEDSNLWNATFAPAKAAGIAYEVHAALLAGGLDSDVQAGENRGRHLHHEFAVLNLIQMPMTTNNGTAKGRFISDTARYNLKKDLAIAVWITRGGQMEPLQATGGWLISPIEKNK